MRFPGTSSSPTRWIAAVASVAASAALATAPSLAFDAPQQATKPPAGLQQAAPSTAAPSTRPSPPPSLASREFFRPELTLALSHVSGTAGAAAAALTARGQAWNELASAAGPKASIYLDPRSGTPASIIAAIPMVPGDGAGNHLTLAALGAALGRPAAAVDAALVEDGVRWFVASHAAAIAVDDAQLGPPKASPVTSDLWQVRIPQVVNGIPVRYAHLSATISHGNMVLFGSEAWGTVRIDTRPSLGAAQALEAGFAYAGGRTLGDSLWSEPHLEIVPFAAPLSGSGGAFTGPIGEGYGHYLVWAFGFHREGDDGEWEVLVDAHNGQILSFENQTRYEAQQIRGAAYPLTNTEICPGNTTCGTMQPGQPMPYANTGLPAPNNFANSAGVYDYPGGTVTTTLNGRFVRMTDTCGTLSESTASGLLDLAGANGQHDCVSAGASPGDTPATRSGYYELNKLIEVAKGWLPQNAWLNAQIVSNMNITATCNAFYQPSNGTINFYRSGGGCRNTGEIAAVFDHEWGHALDDNDSGGALSNSTEAYADIAAIYRLRASCVGYGFWQTLDKGCGMTADGTGFNQNESQTGVYCATNCSGVRDSDWTQHVGAAPATPLGFVCSQCLAGSGPCGRQVHCAAAPAREAAWDLAARDLQGPPFNLSREDAFDLGSKIFFQGSGGIASWNACACGGSSDGCGATNAYPLWLAADDDDGDLTNGTPHMTAIFAAFDRHGIACPSPAPVNSGCAGGPASAPVATASSNANNQIDLAWNTVPSAVKYRVMRSEGYAGCDFSKAVVAEVAGTSYADLEVANDRSYHYVVQPVGTSGACMGPVSPCATGTPLACAGSIGIDKTTYSCSDVIHLSVVDADLAGAGSQTVSVTSSVEAIPESVTLVETPAGSGRFSGAIPTSSAAPAPGDGVLEVAHGGSVTARYVDASSCGAPNVTKQRTATVDCTGQACNGAVSLDRTRYSCSSTLALGLVDSDLAGRGTQTVAVRSTSEPNPETVTLVESPPGSGSFSGTIQATTAPPAHDGRISATDIGVVTLSYADASACGVPNVAVQKTASFDCAGPVISNVRVDAVTGSTARVRWDTNEPSSSLVTYGGAVPPQTTTPVDASLVTAHATPLTGLTECTRQFFSVGSSDEFSQTSVSDNGGGFFTFDVGANVPVSRTAADTPVPIPPGGPFVGISRIDLTDARLVADVDVRLDMTHPFDGQTQIFLRHPDGTLISLSNQHGGSGANYTGTVFDDEAAAPISSAAPPFTGTFRPDGQLSQLDGKSAQGTWQLEVYDFTSGNAGAITGFTLSLQLAQPVCLPGAAKESSLRANDTCAGGGAGSANGYWDDGETVQIQVALRNTGQFDLTHVSASLAPLTPGVVMVDDEATFPDLPRAGTAASAAPHFTAYLPVGFTCATPITFALTIRSAQGNFMDTVDAGISGRPVGASVATDLFESFGAGIPASWTIDNRGNGGGAASTWTTANPGNRTANPPITAPFAIVDSQAAGAGATQEERLLTPPLNLTGVTHVTLEFDSVFVFAAGGAAERGDVDVISTRTGGTPTNVFRYQSSSANPDHRVIDISAFAAGAPDVQIRFRYSGGPLDNWWILDNVKVSHDVPPSCALVSCPVTTAPSEVLHLSWDGRTSASWTPAAGATAYTLYRGVKADLPNLRTTAPDSCARLTTPATSVTGVTDAPPPGGLFWWIVRASNANGAGPAGSGTAGPWVQNTTGNCP